MNPLAYLQFFVPKRRYNSAEIALVMPILVGVSIILIFSLITLLIP